jgi:protoporphyrinogen oxidase
VVLLERADRVGGAAASVTVAGIRADLGSHRLHPTVEPRILGELRRLLGDDLQWRPRNGRIRLEGRWIAFPLRPADLVRRMPPAMALGAVRDAALAPLRRPRADTFAEVLRAALGPAICERFYFPYARKIWGLPPEELAGEQARRRVGASSPGRILRRVLAPPGAARRGFLSPRRGYGQLWEALADDAAAAGARITLGAEVTDVDLAPDGARVTVAGGGEVRGRRVWSTIPLPALAAMARPAPDRAALEAARGLRFRAMLLVYLVLEGGRYSPYDAHYLPEPVTPVTRVSEPPNYRDGDDPAGRTLLCAEIPCDPDDALWETDDDALGRLAADGLAACGLPRPEPAAVHVERLRHAYPVLRPGHEDALGRLDRWAAAQPALLTLGRQGLFVHDNAHHALAMAWAAVDCLRPDGGFDDRAWGAARARFARHVVED